MSKSEEFSLKSDIIRDKLTWFCWNYPKNQSILIKNRKNS